MLAVNVSPLQLRDPLFTDHVLMILAETGFEARKLELEITESALVYADALCLSHLKRLREAHIRIALDDFGTGYSSLNLLRKLELDKVKIDRSFIQHVNEAQDAAAIVVAMTHLRRTLGLEVVAEGVETDEQRTFLPAAGCQHMQGFLFARAASAKELSL
ncbi:EAL domain-containing protein [Pseudomonas luteola]|uniref:EAL domain-containing protein n=1 Tax=Pseudomonas luteola TaxID=47886 RepID=UPI00163A2EF4|nr:EAL domain-containing protein [Pseudomonas luteola]